MKRIITPLLGALLLAACTTAPVDESETVIEELVNAAGADTAETASIDYTDTSNWLCHPGKDGDYCDVDLTTTIVNADGSTAKVKSTPATDPAVDCFYVYPTVSRDTTPNADMIPGPGEINVVEQQFARFNEVCRTYAPTYRQLTLTALRQRMMGQDVEGLDPTLNYRDVKNAWETYLREENDGRGVIIVGHSQGSGLIDRLLRSEIIGTPVADQIISVMPLGMTIHPMENGEYPMPPCESKSQLGCMISYVSFRAGEAPPETSFFGVAAKNGGRAMCVDPVALSGKPMDPRMSNASQTQGFGEGVEVDTKFVSVPGLLSASCQSNDRFDWLAVTVNADPADPRTDTVAGDVMAGDEVNKDWGLHLIDSNITMGNQIDIATAQIAAYEAK
ncbi:MAG: DUF3089 domain-containing protein [Hyphomonas sp.]